MRRGGPVLALENGTATEERNNPGSCRVTGGEGRLPPVQDVFSRHDSRGWEPHHQLPDMSHNPYLGSDQIGAKLSKCLSHKWVYAALR